ncbi:peroxide stress protein YaaA [Stieleria varia]|uniref:UPF0246 protein Pla52n_05950 n=1 Tax=Stieleria varia TaxID=2528005 RepID=A0A5C6B8C4_9BACT|nr:peroxide stress protein YaaA [Stieleria varia]TWU08017.1 hypothetical protein Pla52n_05950 [Stieleria varia]
MLIVVSPAKTLDFESRVSVPECTVPRLLDDAAQLADVLKSKSPAQLKRMMSISDKLAEQNHQRFQDWDASAHQSANDDGSRPAVMAFKGDVYLGLKADEMTPKQLLHAQDHLRILSGMYGILRPLDRMLPYRLEMGTTLKTKRGKDLYAFWGSRITDELNAQLAATKTPLLLNLASNEYFRSVRAGELNASVVAPVFKDFSNGKYKVLSFFAKKARGTMAAWVIKHKVKTLKKLVSFAEDGYTYDEASSTENAPVFLRTG